MRGFAFWALFAVLGTAALMFVVFSAEGSIPIDPDIAFTQYGNGMAGMARNRKLKENGYVSRPYKGNADLEDYNPIDPVPSSKASIRHGPIQHGTPLMPYIPKPSPPDHPKHSGIP